jgi:dephospho-CoA kinase
MLIIGITGTIGAGKGTVVDYLVEHFDFKHYSVRKYLTELLVMNGIEPNRDNFTELANRLRTENNSPSYIIEQLYDQAAKHGQNAIIESIRTVGEIEKLRAMGEFILIAVDADRKLRYDRIYARKSETDNIGFEKFISDEEREMESTNPNNQNIGACLKLADYVIQNNGNLPILYTEVAKIINQFTKKNG